MIVDVDPIALAYRQRRRVGRKQIHRYATEHGAAPAQNPDAFPFVNYAPVTYQDFRLDFTVPDTRHKFYAGVDNAFDRLPPYDLLGSEGGSTYSTVGRFFYAGFEINF